MPDFGYIPRDMALPRSQDYGLLRREGLLAIERLANSVWTDYNIHDPGITLLELFAYAITDLGLRAGYPMHDLLTRVRNGEPFSAGNFHLAHEVLVCNPVSFLDLRKLLIDIPGVRNAWIERHDSVEYRLDARHERLSDDPKDPQNPPLNGLFDVFIEYQDNVVDGSPLLRSNGRTGLTDNSGTGGYIAPESKGIEFIATQDCKLLSVAVYAQEAKKVSVRLTDSAGNELSRSAEIEAQAGVATRITLNFDLNARKTYRLDAGGTTVKLYRTTEAQYPIEFAGVVRISRRTPDLEFVAIADCKLLSAAVLADEEKPVTVKLTDATGKELARSADTLTQPGVSTQVSLSYDLSAGETYHLGAEGAAVNLHRIAHSLSTVEFTSIARLTRGIPAAGYYYFFYDWELAFDSAGLTRDEVRCAVTERIHAHRNLCEDVINICDLNPEEVAVCADIELAPEADTETVQAEILCRLGEFIAPVVRFRSIEELLARGRTMDEIFEGPLLDHGFIDNEEFQSIRRKCEVRTSDVIQEVMNVAGVVAIKNIHLLSFIDDTLRLQADWQLALSTDRFRVAIFSPARSKLIFYKHGLPYYANRKRVDVLLKQRKAADLDAKLKGHRRKLPVPVGTERSLSEFHPVQDELPINYYVGRVRVPQSETAARKAQSRQLRAYLMFFEQNLANFLAQLANLPALFTWKDTENSTYFTQEVAGLVDFADIDRIEYRLSRGHTTFLSALEAIVETPAIAEERRLRLLEHLSARYSETFTEYSALMRALFRNAAGPRLIADRRHFLADYPAVGFSRGTGFDWRRPEVPENIAGYQRRVYRLLGIADVARRRLAGHLFSIVNDGATPPQWHFELRGEAPESGTPSLLFESVPCESKSAIDALLDYCLALGADPANYTTASDGTRQLVQRCAEDEAPEALGEVPNGIALDQVTGYFARYGASEGFHLIEHVLLRRRTGKDPFVPIQIQPVEDCSCPDVADPYSFRVSIVLPSWSPRFRDIRFRRMVEDTLRREAPAHVYARICWVNHEQMRELELALESWQAKLAALAAAPAACGEQDLATRTGRMPLPEVATARDQDYANSLQQLIEVMFGLTTVYPIARLHDCQEADGNTPQVTLNNTSLGTL